jgi:multidrug efflux pump subunit AcrA (membrane-fusion protein)
MKSPLKSYLLVGGALCLLVLGSFFVVMHLRNASGAPQGGSPEVEVVQVEQRDVPIVGEWIGTLDGLVNADVRAQVSGYILRQGYQEGAFVTKANCFSKSTQGPFRP